MIGKKIQIVRKELGYTVEKISEILEISPHTFGSYERNSAKPPYDFIFGFIQKFNVNPYWFIRNEGDMFNMPRNTLEIKCEPLKIDKYELGKRVNKIRITADLNSNQMAEIIDLSEREFAKLCMGELELTPKFLLKLVQLTCGNFNVTADWLLFGKE